RILLVASGAQGEPVAYGSQIAGGAQIGRGRAVELIGALEGAREKDEARSAGGGVVRIGHRRRRLRERNGIGAALERRPGKQLAPLAVELCIEPAGAREQLVDFGPPAPTGGGARRDDQGGGRSRRAVAQHGREQLRRAPWMPAVDQRLRGRERAARRDRLRERTVRALAHVARRVRLPRASARRQ